MFLACFLWFLLGAFVGELTCYAILKRAIKRWEIEDSFGLSDMIDKVRD